MAKKNATGFNPTAWIKRNSSEDPDALTARGECWKCGGTKFLYWAFGDEHGRTACTECNPNG